MATNYLGNMKLLNNFKIFRSARDETRKSKITWRYSFSEVSSENCFCMKIGCHEFFKSEHELHKSGQARICLKETRSQKLHKCFQLSCPGQPRTRIA